MPDSRTEAARRHFDKWSETYEQDGSSRWLREVQDSALALLELRAEDRLLDLACGTGAAVRTAAPLVERAVGCDLSEGMLAQARVRAEGIANVSFVEANVAEGLPFEDGDFTAVLCTTAFHHFSGPERAVAEIARVLAPGGRVVIGDANSGQPLVWATDLALRVLQRSHVGIRRPSRLRADMLAAGLQDVRVQTRWIGAYAFVAASKPAA